jgi:hypothetical protein
MAWPQFRHLAVSGRNGFQPFLLRVKDSSSRALLSLKLNFRTKLGKVDNDVAENILPTPVGGATIPDRHSRVCLNTCERSSPSSVVDQVRSREDPPRAAATAAAAAAGGPLGSLSSNPPPPPPPLQSAVAPRRHRSATPASALVTRDCVSATTTSRQVSAEARRRPAPQPPPAAAAGESRRKRLAPEER